MRQKEGRPIEQQDLSCPPPDIDSHADAKLSSINKTIILIVCFTVLLDLVSE
jgi:hypothetical protein